MIYITIHNTPPPASHFTQTTTSATFKHQTDASSKQTHLNNTFLNSDKLNKRLNLSYKRPSSNHKLVQK